jgi:hypothetical protein
MKLIYSLIVLFITINNYNTVASHIAGGDVTYRYIGDSTGVLHQYEIMVRLYRDASGIAMLNSISVDICSSCYPTSSTSLLLDTVSPGFFHPNLFDCVDPGAPSTRMLEYYVYRGVYTLAGQCQDWAFIFENCCRNGAIDNLVGAAGKGILIRAELNNYYNTNHSSIQFTNAVLRTTAVNIETNISFKGISSDQDSVYYYLTAPKESNSMACGFVGLPFVSGFSNTQPITVASNDTATFNSSTGLFTVTPTALGVYQMSVGAMEYRYDTMVGNWLMVGRTFADVPVIVSTYLNPQEAQGTVFDRNHWAMSYNPNSGEISIDLDCADTLIPLYYYNNIDCITLAEDGSDYWVLDPDKNPLPIISAESECGTLQRSKNIKVKHAIPFTKNGRYVLRHKTGTDGDSIRTWCGMGSTPADSLIINVTGCSGIGVAENRGLKASVFPNPTRDRVYFEQSGISARYGFEVLDLTGKILLSGEGTQVNLAQFPKGIYLLTLQKEGHYKNFQISKE